MGIGVADPLELAVEVGASVAVGLAVGDCDADGVGEGVGPTVMVMGALLVAWVPDISVKIMLPLQVPAGIPFTVSSQFPLDVRTAL